MTDPEHASLLAQAVEQAKREGTLQASASTDGRSVTGEVTVGASGPSWWVKLWAKVTAKADHKADPSAGISVEKRW